MRRAVPIEHGIRAVPDPHRVDHQGVAFEMADGISIPRRCDLCRMRLVHPHMANLVIFVIEEGNLAGLLEYLDCRGGKNEGYPAGPTLVARRRIADAGQRHFAVLLDDVRRLRLQDRVAVVADKLAVVARDAAPR